MARTLPLLLAATLIFAGGCCFYCEHGVPFVVCPDEATVGESVEAMLTMSGSTDFSLEWSVTGEVELSGETTETLEIIPLSSGTITVTVTVTDEARDVSAEGTCAFEAVAESGP